VERFNHLRLEQEAPHFMEVWRRTLVGENQERSPQEKGERRSLKAQR